jgi:hypothetical protein
MKAVKIRHITGGQLSDSNEELKGRFRSFLADDWDLENYDLWITECLRGNLNKELQDILVSLGAKLGFEIEYGRYVGKQGEIGADGIWKLATGESIVLEVKAATWPGPDVSQLAGYMDDIVKERHWDPDKVYGLYIVGDQNTAALIAQIKGSHPKKMRLIKVGDLLKLYQLKLELDRAGEPGLGTEKVQKLLLPLENIDVGDFISLIMEIAEFKQAGGVEMAVTEQPSLAVAAPVSKGRRSTLVPIGTSYTGRTARALVFRGRRHDVKSWKGAMLTLFELLRSENDDGFEIAALTLKGTKRPYITRKRGELRKAERIPNTSLYVETNLSSDNIAKICYTLVTSMGYDMSTLAFETEG